MKNLIPDRDYRIPSACGVTGIMNQAGGLFSGEQIYSSICNMKERGNGLGSGFSAYGIYPDFKNLWCFHIMYEKETAKENTEEYIRKQFDINHYEPIPIKRAKKPGYIPILWRYFLEIKDGVMEKFYPGLDEEDYVIKSVMYINRNIEDSFVFSSGRNMGIFKGVGNPDEIGDLYGIQDYKAYIWTAHNRFPTNSAGWWGGAHPFGILDWSVVHNGEISSYGVNRSYLENSGYYCTLSTDTEVIAYLFDLLVRKHKLNFDMVGNILAPPFWSQIERINDGNRRNLLRTLRIVYGSALVNGPFGIIVANSKYMVGLNDRIKLRPLVAATKGDYLYIASEEAAIRQVCRNPDRVWMPRAGEPTIGRLNKSC